MVRRRREVLPGDRDLVDPCQDDVVRRDRRDDGGRAVGDLGVVEAPAVAEVARGERGRQQEHGEESQSVHGARAGTGWPRGGRRRTRRSRCRSSPPRSPRRRGAAESRRPG